MPMQVQRGNGYIAPINLQPDTRRGGWLAPRSGRITPGKACTHCTGGWVGLGATVNGTENLAPAGIRSLDGPARSESLY
jgi:hypothetical protein